MKNRLSLLLVTAIVLGFLSKLNAQDIHFSQYWASPLYLNPAQAGYFKGDWRVAGIYRNQWKAISGKAFNSAGLSYDRRDFYYSEQINSGILFIGDRSGMVGFNKSKLYLTGSYLKRINGHKLAVGIQPGIVNNTTDLSQYTWDSQFSLGGENVFNEDLDSGEDGNSRTYFDLNAGLLWSKRLDEKLTPTVGLSFHHLTMPKEGMLVTDNKDSRVPIRYTFHGNIEIKTETKLSLLPSIIYSMQKKAREMLIGGNAEYQVTHKIFKSFYGGTHFRYGMAQNYDASVWVIGAKFMNFDVGLSYDINLSGLSEATNNKGAFEISLIYISDNTKPTKIQIPCDRL